ncbi:MAG: hypothetical protein H6579_09830 [Chitinophagales bacterium]|nr:hypothetical protein [Chitinophagales bacterium]
MKYSILAFFLSVSAFSFGQSDQILFKNNEEKEVVLILDNIPTKEDILSYKLPNSEVVMNIPMYKVQRLTLSDGYILYEDSEPIDEVKTTKQELLKNNSIAYDKIELKNGAFIEVLILLEEGQKLELEEELKYKLPNSPYSKSIKLTEVSKVILSNGLVVYNSLNLPEPQKTSNTTNKIEHQNTLVSEKNYPNIEAVVQESETNHHLTDSSSFNNNNSQSYSQTQIICSKEVETLKREIDYRAVVLYEQILKEIEQARTIYSNASFSETETFKKKLFSAIDDEIILLKCNEAFVEAEITIYVDTLGNAIEILDEVEDVKQLRLYTTLRENSIYPYIRNHTFNVVDTLFNYTKQIEDFFDSYQIKINQTNCPQEFEEVLDIARYRFWNIEKLIKSKYTIYKVPIKYSFTSKFQTWIYHNDNVQVKGKGENIKVTDKKILNEFKENLGKKKNGEYQVGICIFSILSDSIQMSISYVKQKYIHYIHIGSSIGSFIPLNNTSYNWKFGEIMPLEGMLIFHRFGLFGGYGLNLTDPYGNTTLEGSYLEKSKYFHGGIYLGLAQYFYFKAGYCQLDSEIAKYSNSIELNRSNFNRKHGFTTGLSLVFPVVHFEGGYNYIFNSPYVSAGLNIPLNK